MVHFSTLINIEEQSFSSNFVWNYEHISQGISKLFIFNFSSSDLKLSKKLVPVINKDFKFTCSTSENIFDSQLNQTYTLPKISTVLDKFFYSEVFTEKRCKYL